MDDGTTVSLQNNIVKHGGFGFFGDYGDLWTWKDAQGRIDHTLETHPRFGSFPDKPSWNFSYKALDYNPETGWLDHAFIRYLNGAEAAIDYDATTGKMDYATITYGDGRVVGMDYNPVTGLLDFVLTRDPDGHTLAQDYDAAEQLDYAVEKWADGRMVATDYDVTDQQPWTTYSIACSDSGQIEHVTVL